MKKRIELVYRVLFVIICAIGVFIHFDLNDRDLNAHEFSFFTVWSNIFCLIYMCVLLIKDLRDKDIMSKRMIYFRGMSMSSILCTFLVYHFSESKIIMTNNKIIFLGLPIESIIAHYIVPAMFIIDWLLFQTKGVFRKRYIFTWLMFPLVYILCFFLRCKCNNQEEFANVPKYPYFFLDYEEIGFLKCLFYIFVLLLIFISINTLIIFIDNMLGKNKKRK